MNSTGKYQPMIGIEVHAQLLTASKMFCGCSARYSGALPNSHVCPVDLGLPGALPVVNRHAVEQGLMVALALHCDIAEITKFDRKNYPYPDIPKGYQISQYDTPLGRGGYVEFEVPEQPPSPWRGEAIPSQRKRVGIIRAHLEEDTGKSIHASVDGRDVSLVDYNRSGVPLLEIVSEPEMTSPEEARRYFVLLKETLVYLGVSTGEMQDGAMRADVNVSVSKSGDEPGVKIEIKNLNSFRAVARAIEFEIERQIAVLERGDSLAQETRGWDEVREVTISQRSKEFAEDYRYFPEPDLPPLRLSQEHIQAVRAAMPELAAAKRKRYASQFGLSIYDAEVLTQESAVANLFDAAVSLLTPLQAKSAANWLTGEFLRLLRETENASGSSRITGENLASLIEIVDDGSITNAIAKTVFAEMFVTGEPASVIVDRHDLLQVSDASELEIAVRTVLDANPDLVAEYVNRNRKTEGPLVGKVMVSTKGKANAALVKEIIASEVAKRSGS